MCKVERRMRVGTRRGRIRAPCVPRGASGSMSASDRIMSAAPSTNETAYAIVCSTRRHGLSGNGVALS